MTKDEVRLSSDGGFRLRGGNAIAGGSLAKYVRSTANDYGAAALADGWGRSIEPL